MVVETPNNCFDAEESWGSEEIAGNTIPLDELRDNQGGRIVKVGTNNKSLTRLCHLGLTPGTQVRKVESAPFGGPIKIRLRGTLLAIGRGLAKQILVSVVEGAPAENLLVAAVGTPHELLRPGK